MARQLGGAIKRYRWRELSLFILPALIMLLSMTQLLLAGADPQSSLNTKTLPTVEGLIPAIGLIGVFVLANVFLSIFYHQADQMLLPTVGLISGIGVMMATRLGPDLFPAVPNQGTKQLIWVLAGFILCMIVLVVLRNPRWLSRYKYSWAVASLAVLLPAVINGIRTFHTNAPSRDVLTIPGLFDLQPSELLKITIVIFFAGYLSEYSDIFSQGYIRLGSFRVPPLRQMSPLLLMLGLSLLIFLVVRELGLAMLTYSLFLCMFYLASGRLVYIIGYLGVFVVLAFVGYSILPYIRDRFATVSFDVINWQNWTQAQFDFYSNQGLQITQGLIALCSGGLFGAGLGLGHPAGRGFVPVVQSDMILTALGEEFGLIGLFAIVGLYLLILYRGYRIAIEANDTFNKLLAAGLTSIFAIQTLIICLGNMKFMPLTGIPLPFLSYGGSSILANFIIVGVLLRISHTTAVENGEE
jgi:cell division protein FtsW (lipid II flippase)